MPASEIKENIINKLSHSLLVAKICAAKGALYIPATKSKLSPGKKKPKNNPVSANTTNNNNQSPPFSI